ncbi:hypothetical protein SH2C18_18530 [Clostridium sediminicola]|uniref:helix-turn-helix domain-containing protein n=1 Tax=Clostridium sediminicola TaxID=3114879 RepID=UPI0031F20BD3
MNLLTQYKKKRVLRTFFISYILMMAMTIVIGSISYIVTFNTITSSVEEYNLAMLQQARTILDEKMSTIQSLGLEIASNSYALKTAQADSLDNSSNIYTIYNLINVLRASKNTTDFIKDIYIYFSKTDTVVNYAGKFSADLFYEKVEPYENITYDQWKDIFRKRSFREFMPVEKINYESYSTEALTFYQPLGAYKFDTSVGAVVIMMDKEVIDNLLENINLTSSGAVFILNNDNEIIMSIGNNELINDIKKENLYTGSDFYNTKFGKVVVSSENSRSSKWRYVSVVPMTSFYEKISLVKKVTFSITLVQLILGIFLALTMSKKNYAPIRKTSEKLMEFIGYQPSEYNNIEDSFSFIQRVTSNTIRENTIIKEKMNSLNPLLRADLIGQLLKGTNYNSDKLTENLLDAGITFNGNRFVVMKIHIDDCTRFIKDNSLQENALVKLIVSNIMEEIGSELFIVYTTDFDLDHIAIIINYSSVSNNNYQLECDQLAHFAYESQRMISNRFNIFTSIGISSIYDGVDNISKCFKEAEEALNYKMIKGSGSIINFKEIENTAGNYQYTFETEMNLINSIKTGDFDKVNMILKNIFSENFGCIEQSLDMARCLFFDMISTSIKVMDELHIAQNEVFGENFNVLNRLLKCRTAPEMHEKLRDIYLTLCNYINSTKKSHNIELRDRIIDYIEKNYGDNGLSLVSVASSLGINSSYLSYFFKEQVGENFINYISRLRINKSKEYLSSTSLTMQDIAEKIGYANSGVYIRAFKKYEGNTPGRYRKAMKKNEIGL